MPIKIGYEIELLSPLNQANFKQGLENIGIRLPNGPVQNPYEHWRLVNDGSLRPMAANHYGHELVSPVMVMEPGLEKLQQIFAWMSQNGHYTNSSCGFHVGVSLDPQHMRNLNALKLALIFDAKHVLDVFGRSENRFCKPIRTYLQNNIDGRIGQWADNELRNGRELNLDEALRGILPQDKYCASNISKLGSPHGAYVEFRGMGGADYHTRFDEIKDFIEYYGEVLEAAAGIGDHKDHDRLYLREFGRLTRSIRSKVNTQKAEILAERAAEEERRREAERREAERRAREAEERRIRGERERAERVRRAALEQERLAGNRTGRLTRERGEWAKTLKAQKAKAAKAAKKKIEAVLWNQTLDQLTAKKAKSRTPIDRDMFRSDLRSEWSQVLRGGSIAREVGQLMAAEAAVANASVVMED